MQDISDLIASASTLPRPETVEGAGPPPSLSNLARQLDDRMLAEPDIDRLVPPEKQPMMRENHRNLTMYMETNLELFDPTSFVNTVIWAMTTYRSHGFAVGYWDKMLPHCIDLLGKVATPQSDHAVAYYRWIHMNLDSLAELTRPEA